ncbi:hypothetical protein Pmar_PMAR006386 [Perkinsus marinus ATCC 50983]|uniref:Uncharacterized protein n=1 Tax=Perkinsus marinus (strain ATCC 50983 / TXsc) TaxID=423536 RepID=C5K9J4_PERM5|nr:hypothetical protein Pmar_PMAR006386 [Perkinsus marinus ATCC 50983]EER18766.1 hypothetical protein Pmar_PMAR006386 [Perkinsus marinus ATCC 50983]|eukprot:XP_002786970.1 hypothetical protein Pmar_PMAR006386 [Perkinsus marinus ATCC 50983]
MLCFPTNYTQFEYEWHPYLSENIDCPYTWNRFMQRCECQEGVIYAKRNPLTSSVMLEADEWHIPCPKRGTGLALPDNGSHWLDRDIPAPERWPHIIPDCHGRGNWSEREGICICEEGWRTTYTPGGTREFCVKNVTTTRPPNSTHAPVWGRIVGVTPTPGQSNSSDTPMIVVAIPFLVVIVGQLFAILWLFKALRRQAKESSSAGTVEASSNGGSASPTGEIHNASAGPLVCAPVKSP